MRIHRVRMHRAWIDRVRRQRLGLDELVNAWVDDRCTPFQLALLAVFDGAAFPGADAGPDLEGIRRELSSRVAGIAEFRRSVVWTRFGRGRPYWVTDTSFEAGTHVGIAMLPGGADLAGWAAQRAARPLDLTVPPWRMDVVGGLPGDRFAILLVVHHLLVDGRGGVAILASLLDGDADGSPATPTPPPTARTLPAPTTPAPRRGGIRAGLDGVRGVLREFAGPAGQTSLPRQIGHRRRLAVVHQPMEEARRVAHALGVTVNDLLLAAVAAGLREQLCARDECYRDLVLKATVPAVTGQAGQVTGLFIADLPVGDPDPLRRLETISRVAQERKRRLRSSNRDVTDLVGHLPVPVVRAFVRSSRRWGSARVIASVANVPGPAEPLWLAGSRLLDAVPIAPLVPLVPLCLAALSYAGNLAITVNAPSSVADLEVFAAGMEREFATLSRAADAASAVAV